MNKEKERLLAQLQITKQDTAKVTVLYQLGLLALDSTREELPGIFNQMLLLSERTNYSRGTAWACYLMAFHKYLKDSLDIADELLDKSIALSQPYNDLKNITYCIVLKANVRMDLGQYPDIILLTDKVPAEYLKQDDSKILRAYYSIRGLAYDRLANYAKSLENHLLAVKEAEKIGDQRLIGRSYLFISSVFASHNEDSMAILYLQKAITINKARTDFSHYYAFNLLSLGNIYEKQGLYQLALENYMNAYAIFQQLPAPPESGIPACYSSFAGIFEKRGDSGLFAGNKAAGYSLYDSAIKYYHMAGSKYGTVELSSDFAGLKILLGRVLMKKGMLKLARENIQEGLALAQQTGDKQQLSDGYLCLSQIDSSEGNIAGAYKNFKLYKKVFDDIFSIENTKLFYQYKNQADLDRKERELQLLETENKLKTTLANQQSQKRKLAYALSGLILLGAGYGVFRYRKINKQKSAQKRLKERLVISQDLHDHVGSTLSSIAVFSKVAQVHAEKGDTGMMHDLLDRIRTTSGNMMSEMNDIVWAINPQNDTLEKIVQRMESFAKPLLAARNIRFQFNYDQALFTENPEMELRKNFYLVFKEAVNNAIKYSGASMLEVDMQGGNGRLLLRVKDNGVGFNPEMELNHTKSLSGNGLRNMMARAREINARLSIQSSPGSGTVVELNYPAL